MESNTFMDLCTSRSDRARFLVKRYSASSDVLSFYATLVSFQQQICPRLEGWETLIDFRMPLVELVRESGPPLLREAALHLDEFTCRRAICEYWQQRDSCSALSFFARVLLQPHIACHENPLLGRGRRLQPSGVDVPVQTTHPYTPPAEGNTHSSSSSIDRKDHKTPSDNLPFLEGLGTDPMNSSKSICPRCGHLPQSGALRPQGEGSAMTLVCSLCLHEWPFRRGRCVACGEESEKNMSYYTAPGFDHLHIQACDTCRTYHHAIDLSKDPAAIPEVDELTALPLDIWAREQGYQKLHPNLAGI